MDILVNIDSALILVWFIMEISVNIYMAVVRYKRESKVCAGDFFKSGQMLEVFPYMTSTAKLYSFWTAGGLFAH